MSDLRSKVIRLAHQNPELRPHLLPLLKEARQIGEPRSGGEIGVLEEVKEGVNNYIAYTFKAGANLKNALKEIERYYNPDREPDPELATVLMEVQKLLRAYSTYNKSLDGAHKLFNKLNEMISD